jgi:hypothetical protein
MHPLLMLLCMPGAFTIAHAGVIYNINMNTAPLVGHSAGPFSLEFQLNDGSGTGDANNMAILNNFLFNGGAAVGSPTLTGGATGNLVSGITLTDSGFFNQFIQGFTPGSSLSFRLNLSTNVDTGGTPDQFTFAILDRTGTELPTLAPSFFDVFIQVDIDSANPLVHTYGTDTNRIPAGGGSAINIAAPTATAVATPEPTMMMLTLLGLSGIFLFRRRSRD